MSGLVGTLGEDQQQVCRLLPYPIAATWQEVLSANSLGQLEATLHAQVEVTARLLGVLLLVDYLRGPVDEPMELAIQTLDKPQPEQWVALVGAAIEALAKRADPQPLLQGAIAWRKRRATNDRDGIAQLAYAVQLRRSSLTAAGVDGTFETSQHIEELLLAVLDLLESLRWLGAYRLMRVVDLTTLRHKGFAGQVQFLVGGASEPPAVDATWTAHLVVDALYLVDPKATQFLEVSPFLRILPHPRNRRPLCFVFETSPRFERLVLAHDASGVRAETTIAGPQGELAFADFLGRRAEHASWQPNVDLLANLAVDPGRKEYTAAKRTVQPRPISGLSQAAFRRGRPLTQVSAAWRSRAGLAVQVGVVAALAVASLVLFGPRSKPKRESQVSDAAARPIARQELAVAPLPAPPSPVTVAVAVAVPAVDAVAAAPADVVPVAAADAVAGPEVAVAALDAVADAPQVAAVVADPESTVDARGAADAVASAEDGKADEVKTGIALQDQGSEQRVRSSEGGDFYAKALVERSVKPLYAVLKLLQAKAAGDARADVALAETYALLGDKDKCRHHALVATARGDAAAAPWLAKCGGDAAKAAAEADPPEDPKALNQRLYAEGYATIYNNKLTPSQRRRLAKDLYADAANRGLAKAHTGLATIYWYGESNRGKCRYHAELGLEGGDAAAKKLLDLCK